MTKRLLTLIICICSFGVSYGQVEILGGIYSDSNLSKPISRVKLILKSNEYEKTIKSDRNGEFYLKVEDPDTEFTLEIRKKGYCTYVLENVFSENHYLRQKGKSKIEFDVILRKLKFVDDVDYEGPSEIIKRKQI